MNIVFKLAFLAIVGLSLNGCALTPEEKMATYKSGGKLVYLSLLGDSFDLSVTGTTVFNNDSNPIDVSDWKIDSYIQQAVIESSKGSQFSFQTIEGLDYEKISRIKRQTAEPDILMPEAKKQGADFLVVVAPKYQGFTHQGDLFNNPVTQYLSGYGLTKLSKFGNERNTSIYSSSKTYIYDLNTMEEIGSKQTVGVRFSKVMHNTKFDSVKASDIEGVKDELLNMILLQSKNHLRNLYICNCW